MEIIVLPTARQVGAAAARIIAAVVHTAPDAVLGLATGSSPMEVYRSLRTLVEHGDLDLSRTRGFALDEYVGIPLDHPQSYAAVIAREVVGPLRMNPSLVLVPDGRDRDVARAAERYEAAIRDAGGIDVQLLGIGTNGHIGFNEPTSSFASRTRAKTLTPSTRADNARFFADADDVPTHCLTQGLGTILEARHLVLVAQGSAKAAAVATAVEGPVSSFCPASALQLHPRATVLLDEDAAAGLTLRDYYDHIQRQKDRLAIP